MLNWPKPFKSHTITIYSLAPNHFIAQASDQVAKMHNFNNKYVIVSLVKLDNFVVLAEYTGCLVLNRSLGRFICYNKIGNFYLEVCNETPFDRIFFFFENWRTKSQRPKRSLYITSGRVFPCPSHTAFY